MQIRDMVMTPISVQFNLKIARTKWPIKKNIWLAIMKIDWLLQV